MGSSETIRRNFSVKNIFMNTNVKFFPYIPYESRLIPLNQRFVRDYCVREICNISNKTKCFSSLCGQSFTGPENIITSPFNENFCTYLTGLIEGDGSIIVPKDLFSKLSNPSVQICFHLKDLPLALAVQKEVKCGKLHRKKGVNAYLYTINNREGLLRLSFCIYRYMRTPKIYDLWKLIDWLNNQSTNIHIPKKGIDESDLLGNGWLSGFIEAYGHFSVRATLKASKYAIECKMEIVQSMTDHNTFSKKDLLEKIAYILHSTVKRTLQRRAKPEYRVRTVSVKGNLVCKEYLEKYPLFGSKWLDFQDWCIVLQFFEKKRHKNKVFYNDIVQIKERMNNNRKNYRWDHLSNFYHLEK